MKVELLVSRYRRMIGLARYTFSLQKHLSQAGLVYTNIEPVLPAALKAAHAFLHPLGYDLPAFFNIYPVSAPLTRDAVKHFTTQMMASMYTFHPGLQKVVITVHDIIPYLVRDDPAQCVYSHFYDRLIDERAMKNLRLADRIIAVSSYTAKMLAEKLGCPHDRIRVVYNGLDHEQFHPVAPDVGFCTRLGLSAGDRTLVYVGSENPRKNLGCLVQALALVKRKYPRIKLLKVGTPEYLIHLDQLKSQIRAAGLEENVIFIDHLSQEDLISLYSVADLFVFPSLYEGFGLPPLEAMACGAAVICSNATSLPEVVGDAAITIDPLDVDAWADGILTVLSDEGLRQILRARGLARAAHFSWGKTAEETLAVYRELDR